jgi:hypothetical protein
MDTATEAKATPLIFETELAERLKAAFEDEIIYLGAKISESWEFHRYYERHAEEEKEKLEANAQILGELFFCLRRLLVRPGCNGEWSGWLRERKIYRKTADGLANRHAEALNPAPALCIPPNQSARPKRKMR